MSPTHTQSQLSAATPISSFVESSFFILAIALVSCHIYFNQNVTHIYIEYKT